MTFNLILTAAHPIALIVELLFIFIIITTINQKVWLCGTPIQTIFYSVCVIKMSLSDQAKCLQFTASLLFFRVVEQLYEYNIRN
jgi:hypothetical protein